MLPLFLSIFESILLGIFLTFLSSWAGIWLARRFNLIDVPGILPHKQHAEPVPLAGGLALFPALVIGFWVFHSDLDNLWKLLLPLTIVFLTGLVDDRHPLPYSIKLSGQIIAAGLLVFMGFQVNFLKPEILPLAPIILKVLNILFTLLWLVGTTNAFNFVDSMDGLATGISAIVATFLAAASMFSGQIALARLMGLLVGTWLVL